MRRSESLCGWLFLLLLVQQAVSEVLDVQRLPGHPFQYNNITFGTTGETLLRCTDQLLRTSLPRGRTLDESNDSQTCSAVNLRMRSGPVCLSSAYCPAANYTCCNELSFSNEQFNVACEECEITVCKVAKDSWRSLLYLQSPRNLVNVSTSFSLSSVLIGNKSIIVPPGTGIKIVLESELSILPQSIVLSLESAFNRFCDSSKTACAGDRQIVSEYNTGSFACFSPPKYTFPTYRDWLETSFPSIELNINDDSSATLCISPWSYFVPVAPNVVCVGILKSQKGPFILGTNLLEGNKLRFVGEAAIKVSTSAFEKCIPSSVCQVRSDTSQNDPSRTAAPLDEDVAITSEPSPAKRITVKPTTLPTLRPTTRSKVPATSTPTPAVGAPSANDEAVDPSSQPSIPLSPWVWFGIGSGVTLFVNCVLLIYCRCCRSGPSEAKFSRLSANVEMTVNSPVVQVANQNTSGPSTPQTRPSLQAAIAAAAAPFEPNPTIPSGASGFEKAWNQGLIVDVWGITLKIWQPTVAVDTLTKLRLLRVASGTVSGVEKMYWMAKQRPPSLTSSPVLGMIEISVDLTTRRLSAVFKMSRSVGAATTKDSQDLHTLFDAFKRAIEEVMC